MAETPLDDVAEDGSLVLEQRFAIIPEWIIDAEISDCAYRLYSVLLRYGRPPGSGCPAGAPWPQGCTRARRTPSTGR